MMNLGDVKQVNLTTEGAGLTELLERLEREGMKVTVLNDSWGDLSNEDAKRVRVVLDGDEARVVLDPEPCCSLGVSPLLVAAPLLAASAAIADYQRRRFEHAARRVEEDKRWSSMIARMTVAAAAGDGARARRRRRHKDRGKLTI